jgi:hypothetical protein
VSGQLVPVKIPGLQVLAPENTRRVSDELIGSNKQAIATLQEQGSSDISYSLPGQCRFRVNIFVQRGSHAIVMQVIPKSIPSFADRCARPAIAMKVLMVIIMLAVMVGILRAQETHYASAVHPYVTRGDLAASRFWTRGTIALVALDGAAKATDSYITRRNIDGGGEEYNPMARPFVHTTTVQVAATAALFGAEVATAYMLHRRHHDNVGRAVLLGGVVMNGLGATSSFRHRVADW